MSARSPRGSLSGASSAEVADDFGESLKDLQMNNRYEISNLTLIAKENTEHAQAISKTLENHIRRTAPPRKLPALYVLDSIVKNVGTPYTLYLSRDLYRTFMDAYTLVDAATRRNMEAMLKTWKEPVPGALDSTPVFQPDIVRPIENALIRYRTVLMQNNRQVQNPAHHQPFRNTPTPPQLGGRYGAPPTNGQAQPVYGGVTQLQHSFSPGPASQQPNPYTVPDFRPVSDVEAIKRDVGALVEQRQAQSAANPFDAQARQELDALLQLQNFLNTQPLDTPSLQAIRSQITALSARSQPTPTPQPSAPAHPHWQYSPPVAAQSTPVPSTAQLHPPSHQQPPPPLPFLDPAALNGLQALLASGQKPGTPQMRATAPALQNASHSQLSSVQNQTAGIPALNGADLIASLAKSGLLPPANATPPVSTPFQASQPSTVDLLKALSNQGVFKNPTPQHGTPSLPYAALANSSRPRIPMDASALKTFRPELVHNLYAAQPNQCSTCGRRFPATDDGKTKKARHLDWHFRTNQRMANSSTSRGAHRQWYENEIDWVRMVEFDASTTAAGAGQDDGTMGGSGVTKPKEKKVEDQFVRAPPGVTRNTCSIDFEEMKSTYSEDLQDWIFTNAAIAGGKIVHATCLAEMQKGQQFGGMGGTGGSLAAALGGQRPQRQQSATPDSTLGKRKAETPLAGMGAKMRVD